MKIEWDASPNCRQKPNREISAIVIHYTASMHIGGTVAWFKNTDAGVSAHYVIGRKGEVIQMVQDEDIAHHAGVSALDGRPHVNAYSLGIELVGTADSGFTVKQLDALYRLLEELVVKYDIPASRVVGHADVAPTRKIDPDGHNKQFPWKACDWVVRDARRRAGLTAGARRA